MLKTFETIRQFFDGKKQAIASLATALAATSTILAKLSGDGGGLHYLATIATTPEFAAAGVGWIGFFNAMKGQKIRAENGAILNALDAQNPSAKP